MLLVFAAGCVMAGPDAPARTAFDSGPAPTLAVKRVVVGVPREPDLHPDSGGGQGILLRTFLNPGLGTVDDQGVRRPVLAEAVPSLENGLWKLLPDGRMETTWTLRAGAHWHDGVPVTTEDLLFALQLGRHLPSFDSLAFRPIEEAIAVDARTLTVRWKEPYIDADALFTTTVATPLPRHRLEAASRADPDGFPELPFWTDEYVGAGPYRVAAGTPGLGMNLRAFPDYVLGRPMVDEIEIRVISDPNAMLANILAGAVDVAPILSSMEAGIQIRDQWRNGTVIFRVNNGGWLALYPQFINPQPAVVADVRFRRALVHAVDRQSIADTLAFGMSPVAHTFVAPNQPEYREIEAGIPHYDFDSRLAAQMLDDIGLRRAGDGTYRDATDIALDIELRSNPPGQAVQTAETIADTWRRLGVTTRSVGSSPAGLQSAEYSATFPAFVVRTRPSNAVAVPTFHSSRTLLPENNFRVSRADNVSRYMNPALDALVDRYHATVPRPQRAQVLGEIASHVADQVVAAGIYYVAEPTAVASRMLNVTPAENATAWNSHAWDVRN